MPLDPPLAFLAQMLAAQPANTTASLAERRAESDRTLAMASTGRPDDVTATDHVVAVEDGEIRVRVLNPRGDGGLLPGLLFLHGGGWFQGNLDTSEVECGALPWTVPCVVVSVEYRLAPEHPFPTALHDCLTAYQWLLDNAAALGIDADTVGIGGTSAGANLTAALCLLIRDRGLPMPVVQLLDVPFLDLTMTSASIEEFGNAGGLTAELIDEFVRHYLGDRDRRDPLASPLHAPDLSGLPPAVIVVAELDPVRDDGERYLTRLHEAGVPATAIRVISHFHGGWVIPITATAGLVNDFRASALRRAFAGELVPDLSKLLAALTPA